MNGHPGYQFTTTPAASAFRRQDIIIVPDVGCVASHNRVVAGLVPATAKF
jgi:hypothetical protein